MLFEDGQRRYFPVARLYLWQEANQRDKIWLPWSINGQYLLSRAEPESRYINFAEHISTPAPLRKQPVTAFFVKIKPGAAGDKNWSLLANLIIQSFQAVFPMRIFVQLIKNNWPGIYCFYRLKGERIQARLNSLTSQIKFFAGWDKTLLGHMDFSHLPRSWNESHFAINQGILKKAILNISLYFHNSDFLSVVW